MRLKLLYCIICHSSSVLYSNIERREGNGEQEENWQEHSYHGDVREADQVYFDLTSKEQALHQ